MFSQADHGNGGRCCSPCEDLSKNIYFSRSGIRDNATMEATELSQRKGYSGFADCVLMIALDLERHDDSCNRRYPWVRKFFWPIPGPGSPKIC